MELAARIAEGGRLLARRLRLSSYAVVTNLGREEPGGIVVDQNLERGTRVSAFVDRSGYPEDLATIRVQGEIAARDVVRLLGDFFPLHAKELPVGVEAANDVVDGAYVLAVRNTTPAPVVLADARLFVWRI
jgi:CBS domain-containing protein